MTTYCWQISIQYIIQVIKYTLPFLYHNGYNDSTGTIQILIYETKKYAMMDFSFMIN